MEYKGTWFIWSFCDCLKYKLPRQDILSKIFNWELQSLSKFKFCTINFITPNLFKTLYLLYYKWNKLQDFCFVFVYKESQILFTKKEILFYFFKSSFPHLQAIQSSLAIYASCSWNKEKKLARIQAKIICSKKKLHL